VLDGLTT